MAARAEDNAGLEEALMGYPSLRITRDDKVLPLPPGHVSVVTAVHHALPLLQTACVGQ